MNKQRIYSVDALKIVATVLIVFHHYQQVTGASFQYINFYNGLFEFNCVVEFFFILSGFFAYNYAFQITDGLSFKDFYLRRVIRLLPLVAISAVVYELFLGCYHAVSNASNFGLFENSLSLWGTLITALGVQAGWGLPNPAINNPTWYVSVLLLCYIVFYLSCYISQRLSVPAIYIHAFIILGGMGIITYRINLPFLNSEAARGYYAFFFGIILATYMKNNRLNSKLIMLFSLLIILFVPYLLLKHNHIINSDIYYVMTFLYYPSLIILFSGKIGQRLFSSRILGIVGQISYNVYIWHLPFLLLTYVVIAFFNISIDLSQFSSMLIFTMIAFFFGAFSHFFIEKPICKFLSEKMNV